MKERLEIVASGFGGQGVVRLGQTLGEAAVRQGLRVTMLKSHGTEMRGGYVRSQVVLSEKQIDSPMCETPDVFLALSSSAYNRFKDTVPESGVIVYDPAFVEEIDPNLPCRQISAPAKEIAVKNFKRPIFSNAVALGFLAKLLEKMLDKNVVLESFLEVIPKYREENRQAFEMGYEAMKD
jgi:2-oxoglutarate ferredoxin oxidoreductase subunit gamma